MPLKPYIAHWRIITNATRETQARKVLGWALAKLDNEAHQSRIEPYHKGGFVISFSTESQHRRWPEVVLDVLSLAERVGSGWGLAGPISESVDACCSKSTIPGISFMHVVCFRVPEAHFATLKSPTPTP